MRLLSTRDDLRQARLAVPEGADVAAVLTMGGLHAGHLALVDAARSRVGESGVVVMTVFVNPLQFGEGEDLARYPGSVAEDVAAAERAGVDLVFAPSASQMYPDGEPTVTVDPGELGTILEGAARPTHFRGVLTVVAKLFNLVVPSVTVFGEKDYQQLVLVRRMSRELELGVDVVAAPTVREPDGLAMSSRNAYLSTDQRRTAVALSRALSEGREAAIHGRETALAQARRVLDTAEGVDVDYLVLTGPDLDDPPASGEARLLVAAQVGTTRLLDNTPVSLGAPG